MRSFGRRRAPNRLLAPSLLVLAAGCASAQSIAPALSEIQDPRTWRVLDADATARVEGGQSVVSLQPHGDPSGGSHIGLALAQGVALTEGTLELDLRGRGPAEPSFLGVAFGVADSKTFEAVYFRPFRFASDDVASRVHAVQYVAWPDYTWEKLRRQSPGIYESAIRPVPDASGWFHARIEVTKQKVRVWVDGAKEPCLMVDRLGEHDGASVGLWVDSIAGQFRNFRIRAARK